MAASTTSSLARGICLAVLALLGLVALTNIVLSGRTVALPDAPAHKLQCASYTPSHDGHVLGVDEKRALVAADLRILAERFECVRTYSVSPGLDDVPKVARELGLKVMLGLWISSHGPSNDEEIARGIALANEYRDVVTAVIVGNEVLLRREQNAAQLQALIERVRAGVSAPVTYADVWEFWLRNPSLTDATHFVTIHILPYWEDHPIDIDRAVDHIRNIRGKVQSAFPTQRIFIGETGWPSTGRPRLNAVPSQLNQARFLREFISYAERERIAYNLIEAFDQPWKRIQEGTVGGAWGLYDAQARPKFALSGPLQPNPLWRVHLILALLAGAVAWFTAHRASATREHYSRILCAIAGTLAAGVLIRQWDYLSAANRTTLEWLGTGLWAVTGATCFAMICVALSRAFTGGEIPHPPPIAQLLHNLGRGAPDQRFARWLGILRFAVLFGAAYTMLGLTYEGRGRDFPLSLLLLPATGLVLLEVMSWLRPNVASSRKFGNEEFVLCGAVAIGSLFVAYNETWLNQRAMLWCALNFLLAGVLLVGAWRSRLHPHQHAQQQPQSA